VLAYGSPGGPTIINSVFNLTLNLADHGMGVQEAIDAPRLSVTAPDGAWACEGEEPFMQPRFAVAAQDTLRALGHPVPGAAGNDGCTSRIGSVQAVAIDLRTGRRWGGADRRREGSVLGQDAAAPLAEGPR
jgi:gamma-glutamyltranspeptidase/glutathione hydrolase